MKKLHEIVRKYLTKNIQTRGDDDLLYILILENEMGVNLSEISARDFLLEYRKENLPTIETVGRCRRKAQEENKDLLPDENIILNRKKCEKKFYNYSKGVD